MDRMLARHLSISCLALASLLLLARLATSQAPPQPGAAKAALPECADAAKLRSAKLPNPNTVIRSTAANPAQQAKGKAQPAPVVSGRYISGERPFW